MKKLITFIIAIILFLAPLSAFAFAEIESVEYSHVVKENSLFSIKGILETPGLEGSAEAELYDVRLLTSTRLGDIAPDDGGNLDLSAAESMINALASIGEGNAITFPFAGEMELRLTYMQNGGSVRVSYPIYFCGKNPICFNVTDQITYINNKDMNKGRLSDNNYNTLWDPSGKRELIFTIPSEVKSAMVQLEWTYAQNEYTLTCYDSDDNITEVFNAEDMERLVIRNFYPPENTVKCMLKITAKKRILKLGELHVYDMDRLSPMVQQWEPTPEKADIMVISAHQDDELLFFGATVPDSVARGKSVVMLYMANCGRMRYAEALAGMWSSGLRAMPVFLNYDDQAFHSYTEATNAWPRATVVDKLVYNIRKYRPEVIVTHDEKGEYGHIQHKLTSDYVQRAVKLAASSSYVCSTDKKLEAWQVKKLYIHLYPENVIHLNSGVPSDFFGGFTTQEIAELAYDKHYTQHGHYSMDAGTKYDNTAFGLVSSTVGEDVRKDDLFENLE